MPKWEASGGADPRQGDDGDEDEETAQRREVASPTLAARLRYTFAAASVIQPASLCANSQTSTARKSGLEIAFSTEPSPSPSVQTEATSSETRTNSVHNPATKGSNPRASSESRDAIGTEGRTQLTALRVTKRDGKLSTEY